jgi:hypothetical protein
VYDEYHTLIPDTVLQGNATGFSTGPVDISGIDPVTYPALSFEAVYATNNNMYTPVVDDWGVRAIVGPLPAGNIPLVVTGTKTKGMHDGSPVLLVNDALVTDTTGFAHVGDLLWDIYTVIASGSYDIVDSCPLDPYNLNPNEHPDIRLIVDTHTTYSLRIRVIGDGGLPVSDASVHVTTFGYDETVLTSACGQAFFPDLGGWTHTVEITAPGYATRTDTVSVSGTTTKTFVLTH